MGLAHIDRGHRASGQRSRAWTTIGLDATEGLERECRHARAGIRRSWVDEEFRHAADAVAAHLGSEPSALKMRMWTSAVGTRRGPDQDQAVGADAEVAVADPGNRFGREVELLGEVFDDDEIVTKAVHFDEGQFHMSELLLRL